MFQPFWEGTVHENGSLVNVHVCASDTTGTIQAQIGPESSEVHQSPQSGTQELTLMIG